METRCGGIFLLSEEDASVDGCGLWLGRRGLVVWTVECASFCWAQTSILTTLVGWATNFLARIFSGYMEKTSFEILIIKDTLKKKGKTSFTQKKKEKN